MIDCLFIHINKCGGSSVKKVIGDRQSKYQKYKHERIADIKARMPEDEFNNTFKFAFIRNPYDRIASMYFYRKYNLGRKKLEGVGFQEWFMRAFTEPDYTAVPLMNAPCWDFISVDGNVPLDFLGTFENMDDDWKTICSFIGIDKPLPKVNETARKEPVEYTEEMKQIIERKFKKDLGYYETRRY